MSLCFSSDDDSEAITDVIVPKTEGPQALPPSPEKWVVSSPSGSLKLKMNRVRKPQQQQQGPSSLLSFHQRVSRNKSKELGISPGKLSRVMTASPSPKRKRVPAAAAESPTLTPMSVYNLTTSPLVSGSSGRMRRSEEGPSSKRRKVNKKLYDEKK